MTAIEFFNRTPLDNVVSSLTTVPDKIIFIGENKQMKAFEGAFQTFLAKRGLEIEVDYRSVPQNDIDLLVKELSAIVETEEDCVFDLTGGEDLALVALGMVYQKYRDTRNIQLQRFNMRSGVVTDCDRDGTVVYTGKPTLSVEELIGLHGGVIREETEEHVGTYPWELTPDFVEDVELLWSLCRDDPGRWNAQLNVMGVLQKFVYDEDPLSILADMSALRAALFEADVRYTEIDDLLRFLDSYGLIEDLENDGQRIIFAYKNDQVRHCLAKAGTVLELKVLIAVRQLTGPEGTAYYSDSMAGVFIDWDGDLHSWADNEKDTENEVDVVLMRGMQPVFISCKNGAIEEDELYKLSTVTERFGGTYARKVLIATYLGKKADSMGHFRQRAADMKIQFIEGVHEFTDQQFLKMVKHLVIN